jgi:hypothetical protein
MTVLVITSVEPRESEVTLLQNFMEEFGREPPSRHHVNRWCSVVGDRVRERVDVSGVIDELAPVCSSKS